MRCKLAVSHSSIPQAVQKCTCIIIVGLKIVASRFTDATYASSIVADAWFAFFKSEHYIHCTFMYKQEHMNR